MDKTEAALGLDNRAAALTALAERDAHFVLCHSEAKKRRRPMR